MKELEDEGLRTLFKSFSNSVNKLRKDMEEIKQYDDNYLTKGKMLDCAEQYCRQVTELSEALSRRNITSPGLSGFASYLLEYSESASFTKLGEDIGKLRAKLSSVEYCLLIKNDTIKIREYEGQEDYSIKIHELFERFRQGEAKEFKHILPEDPEAPHVEAAVLNIVAELNEDEFKALDGFCKSQTDFFDEVISRFAGEIRFYISWLEHTQQIRNMGLSFNYPEIRDKKDNLYCYDMFDIALAFMLEHKSKHKIVTNDFTLDAPERIIVVTGPNQGGKTTFARAFGQLHWLASLGLCVPGSKSALCLFDNIHTHFGIEEDLETLNGKLMDDLERLRDIQLKATESSIIIVNEIYSSTTLLDALTLGGRMMDYFAELGALAVCVTFLDELASHGEETVSMMSTVEEDDPARRTFKVVRKPPDGLAYAMHIAGKYGLRYDQLDGRLRK
ncbi:MAG: DNA mismatch repair protein MutS [Clostridiales bacterium]|nr:DNA mismatch repair protein MutS [Clostridiales bacterium]